jgi:hypothetical protein
VFFFWKQASIEEAAALRERSHGLAAQLDSAAREAREATEALRSREAALEAAQRTAAERKRAADEEAERLARERVKRQRLEEDVKVRCKPSLWDSLSGDCLRDSACVGSISVNSCAFMLHWVHARK